MTIRFRLSREPSGYAWESVQGVLDDLAAGRVHLADYIFDVAAQEWVRIGLQPDIAAALAEREQFRSPDAPAPAPPTERTTFPSLSPEGATPIRTRALSRAEAALRAQAMADVAGADVPVPTPIRVTMPVPAKPAHSPAELAGNWLSVAAIIIVLVMAAWGVLEIAQGVGGIVNSTSPTQDPTTGAPPNR